MLVDKTHDCAGRGNSSQCDPKTPSTVPIQQVKNQASMGGGRSYEKRDPSLPQRAIDTSMVASGR
jgi:hypothetical protein